MYEKAERESGVVAGAQKEGSCFFVDDSALNCRAADERGWTVVHLVEEGLAVPERKAGRFMIRRLEELRGLFPRFFRGEEGKEINGVVG